MSRPYKDQSGEQTVTLLPTDTILVAPLDVTRAESLAIEIVNLDMAVACDVYVEVSTRGDVWTRLPYDGFFAVAASTAKYNTLDVRWFKFIRLIGVSGGIGNNVRVTYEAIREYPP